MQETKKRTKTQQEVAEKGETIFRYLHSKLTPSQKKEFWTGDLAVANQKQYSMMDSPMNMKYDRAVTVVKKLQVLFPDKDISIEYLSKRVEKIIPTK